MSINLILYVPLLRTFGRGIAQSVTVLSTGKVDDAYTVKFYDSSTCTLGTEVAIADNGCLTIDSVTVQGYRSFNVVLNSIDTPTRKKPRASNGMMGFARKQTFAQPNIKHGQLATFHGVEYKLQQVSASGWTGILPHQWDDDIHIPNYEVLALHPDLTKEADFLRPANRTGLEERGLIEGLCKVTASCISTAQTGQAAVVQAVRPWLTDAFNTALSQGKSVNKFLNNNPFFSQFLIRESISSGSSIGKDITD